MNALKKRSCYELFDGERRQDYSSGPTLTLKPKARRQARDASSKRDEGTFAKDINPRYHQLTRRFEPANRSANRYSALAILEDQSPVCPCFHVFFNFFSYRSSGLVRVRENQRLSLHQHGSSGMERTINLLSAFINLIKFTEQRRYLLVEELRDKSTAMLAERK